MRSSLLVLSVWPRLMLVLSCELVRIPVLVCELAELPGFKPTSSRNRFAAPRVQIFAVASLGDRHRITFQKDAAGCIDVNTSFESCRRFAIEPVQSGELVVYDVTFVWSHRYRAFCSCACSTRALGIIMSRHLRQTTQQCDKNCW